MASKLRIVFPVHCNNLFNWERFASVLKPLSRDVDVTVYYFSNQPAPPPSDWCRIVRVPAPENMTNLKILAEDALKITCSLPDFDVLYTWSSEPYNQLLTVLVAEAAQKPIVMHVCGDADKCRSIVLTQPDTTLQNMIDHLSLNNTDLLIPLASELQQKILQRIKNKQAVSEPVPFPVDTQQFTPSPYPKEITVGYSGRVSPEKGFPFYQEVMQQTKASFRLVGPFQMNLTLPENCHYHGVLGLTDMPQFYSECSVVALPSFSEGLPGIILESYASGRPVVVASGLLPSCLPLFGWSASHSICEWKQVIEGLTQSEIEEKGKQAQKWVTSNWLTKQEFALAMNKKFMEACSNAKA